MTAMVIGNSSTRNSSTSEEQNSPVDENISFGTRIFLGLFIITLAGIGIIGNTIVITVLRLKNVFMRKTTSLILTSLASVDLLGSIVDIPLAFSTMVVASPVDHLYNLSLTQEVIGPCLFWGYITCFFLLSIDRNDALRKISNRQEFLTTKRILVVLILAIASSAGLALFFALKTENPNPLLPRKTAPKVVTAVRGVLFLLFVIAVSCNIYLYMRVKKIIKEHSVNVASESEEQRYHWQMKERTISWTIIQVVLVVCLSYVPYIIASVIYSKRDIRSLNAIAICRSLTYLKYAVNVFIFTRLDGKFIMAFVEILRCAFRNNKVCTEPIELLRDRENQAVDEGPQHESASGNNKPTCKPKELTNGKLIHLQVSGRQGPSVREYNKSRTRTQSVPLPIITITSPTGKIAILKGMKSRGHKVKNNTRPCNYRTSNRKRSETV